MKTFEGNYVMCSAAGKICYTEREAGIIINAVRNIFIWVAGIGRNHLMVILNQFLAANITVKIAAIFI